MKHATRWFLSALLAFAATVFAPAALAAPFDMIAAYRYVEENSRALPPLTIWRIIHTVEDVSDRTGVTPERLLSLIKHESSFSRQAVSNVGAQGLMQVMPRYHPDKLQLAKQLYGTADLHNLKVGVYVGALVMQEYGSRWNTRTALLRYSGGKRDYPSMILREEARIKQRIYPAYNRVAELPRLMLIG